MIIKEQKNMLSNKIRKKIFEIETDFNEMN